MLLRLGFGTGLTSAMMAMAGAVLERWRTERLREGRLIEEDSEVVEIGDGDSSISEEVRRGSS